MAKSKEQQTPDAILDQLLCGPAASTAFGRGELLDQLWKALAERAPNAEMHHHLACQAGAANSRRVDPVPRPSPQELAATTAGALTRRCGEPSVSASFARDTSA